MENSRLNLRKIKCTRCGKLTEVANTQSRQKDGLITAYCYNQDHNRLKIRVITDSSIPRTIRSNRMRSTIKHDDSFNLRRLKCVLCGKKLRFNKKGSYQGGGKIQGFCRNNKLHRLKVQIFSKLMNEPDFDELEEVIIRQSDR